MTYLQALSELTRALEYSTEEIIELLMEVLNGGSPEEIIERLIHEADTLRIELDQQRIKLDQQIERGQRN